MVKLKSRAENGELVPPGAKGAPPAMLPRISSLAILFGYLLLGSVAAGEDEARTWLAKQGYVAPTGDRVIACHGYGCAHRAVVAVDSAFLGRLSAIMSHGRSSPAAERQALGEAVRMFGSLLAARIGGRPDEPRSPPGLSGTPGQMDCLDITANTTSLLIVLEEHELLVHHVVSRPQSRGVFFDGRYPHFTAVISEVKGGTSWAVDPWTRAPGQKPDIMPLRTWEQGS